MSISWKKLFVKLSDLIILIYLIAVFVSFGTTSEADKLCKGIYIEMLDGDNEGFLSKSGIEDIMRKNGIYPLNKKMKNVSPYTIEKVIGKNPFIDEVNCYKTHRGILKLTIKQRTPVFMAVTEKGERYFMDTDGRIMPESSMSPYVMVVTGVFNKTFATSRLIPLVSYINSHSFWKKQVEQINVIESGGIEIIPRVGNHTVYIGKLPNDTDKAKNIQLINKYLDKKLTRLYKFYKYGLSKAGWNRYSYINIEFDNQIICKKKKHNI